MIRFVNYGYGGRIEIGRLWLLYVQRPTEKLVEIVWKQRRK